LKAEREIHKVDTCLSPEVEGEVLKEWFFFSFLMSLSRDTKQPPPRAFSNKSSQKYNSNSYEGFYLILIHSRLNLDHPMTNLGYLEPLDDLFPSKTPPRIVRIRRDRGSLEEVKSDLNTEKS
jgi:hypothetical protein